MQTFDLYLVKVGEIILKAGNRREFENRLKSELNKRLGDISHRVEYTPGRFFVEADAERSSEVEGILARTPGVNGFAKTLRREKTIEAVRKAALAVATRLHGSGKRSFKVESRRSDKSFPLGSFELSSELGAVILESLPELRVDLHHPDFIVNVEIRDKAYIFAESERGLRGLPTGTQGRGLLLLSGGIDSPVAGYLMARRGLDLEALYFHAWPYTSKEAHDKVKDLCRLLAAYTGGITLWTVPFTEVQLAIKKNSREDLTTLMMKTAMTELAQAFALKRGDLCLVTGESLGQVASQTAENMRLTQYPTNLPLLRPLVGMDKEDTIAIAKEIGSFEISIRPYEDCCVIFSPAHPLLRAKLDRERAAYEALGLGQLLAEAMGKVERMELPFSERIVPAPRPALQIS